MGLLRGVPTVQTQGVMFLNRHITHEPRIAAHAINDILIERPYAANGGQGRRGRTDMMCPFASG